MCALDPGILPASMSYCPASMTVPGFPKAIIGSTGKSPSNGMVIRQMNDTADKA
jgi:hypothetical protein